MSCIFWVPSLSLVVAFKYELTFDQKQVRKWLLSNRGILSQISVRDDCLCSRQFVRQVAYGVSMATEYSKCKQNVERALRSAGWPGVGR